MMEKQGAAMFVWTNIASDAEDQMNEWYSRDHLEERISIVGFVRVRRFIAIDASRKYLAFYEMLNTRVMIGADYLASINNPRPTTIAMVRKFRDTARVISHVRQRAGDDGGILATVTIEVTRQNRPALDDTLARFDVAPLALRPGVVGAGLMEEDADISSRRNAGKDLRTTEDGRADWILVVEGIDRAAVVGACDAFLNQVRLPSPNVTERSLYRFLSGKNAFNP